MAETQQKPSPTPEEFGFVAGTIEGQGGWEIEGGEEAYWQAVAAWEELEFLKIEGEMFKDGQI